MVRMAGTNSEHRDRSGTVSFKIDLSRGRDDWLAAGKRIQQQASFPAWRKRLENTAYLFFGQSWPNSNQNTVLGWLTLWTRWIWAPVFALVGWALCTARYRGRAWVVPLCGFGSICLLLLQNEGVMEGRFREPLDAILLCAALLIQRRSIVASAKQEVAA
jgi:hypothetical protein